MVDSGYVSTPVISTFLNATCNAMLLSTMRAAPMKSSSEGLEKRAGVGGSVGPQANHGLRAEGDRSRKRQDGQGGNC